jgi:hypothetical protein
MPFQSLAIGPSAQMLDTSAKESRTYSAAEGNNSDRRPSYTEEHEKGIKVKSDV